MLHRSSESCKPERVLFISGSFSAGQSACLLSSYEKSYNDIAHLIAQGDYLEFEESVPIPVDFHVRNVTIQSGLIPDLPDPNNTASENLQQYDSTVQEAWSSVVGQVDSNINGTVSVLRVDSIVWQLGQKIYRSKSRVPKQDVAEYVIDEVGIPEQAAERLAEELLWKEVQEVSNSPNVPPGVTPITEIDSDGEWIDELIVEVETLWENNHDSIDQTGLISDQTGSCKFTKSKKAALPEVKDGKTYRLESVVTDEYEGRYSVSLDSASSISELDQSNSS